MSKNNTSYAKKIWTIVGESDPFYYESYEDALEYISGDGDILLVYELVDVGHIKEDRKFVFVSDKKKSKKK